MHEPEPRPSLARRLLLCGGLGMGAGVGSAQSLTRPSLQYEMTWAGPWKVRTQVRNPASTAIWLLRWGTPFEAEWLAPWLQLWLDDRELPYEGASAKRGEPQASDYFRLSARQARSSITDLKQAFALGAPGRYRLRSQWHWHDAIHDPNTRPPRARELHQGLLVAPLELFLKRG